MTYIALLRGINVGGKNIIKMVDLCTCFEQAGYENVSTYIQSGNVIFDTNRTSPKILEEAIEKLLERKFKLKKIVVVVLSTTELSDVVYHAPKNFGKKPDKYRYDVIFMKRPLQPDTLLKSMPLHPDIDTAVAGKHTIYTTRLIEKTTKSRLSRITTVPEYKSLTIRNWNTTTKLLSLITE